MFRSAFLIISGNSVFYFLLLVRNLLVARLIPEVDYGIAATFAMAMTVVEMMSALGLQQQIIQAKDGNDPRFQAGVQGFHLLRGVIASSVLFLMAGPIANLMRVPDVTWAYQVMAFVPLLNALQHFDMHRFNRDMVFWPVILTNVIPGLLSVLSVFAFAIWFGDYRVMLYALLVQALGTMVASHLVAERRYQLLLDRTLMVGSLRFGWPILLDAIVLFAIFNGDKVIVGRELGMATLAFFAMGVTLTLTPTLVVTRSTQNFMLPQLAPLAEDRGSDYMHLANITVQITLVMGMLLVVGTLLLGQPIVYLLLGDKYLPLLPLLGWFAILHGLRVFKSGPAVVALSAGQTVNAMLGNLVRVMLLPIAWWVAVNDGDIEVILWIGILGEILGHVLVMLLLWWRIGVPMRPFVMPHLGAGLVFFVAAWLMMRQPSQPEGFWLPSLWEAGIMLAALVAGLGTMRSLWQYGQNKFIKTS